MFILVWPVVGTGAGLLPLWLAEGSLRDGWAVSVWGQLLAGPMLASYYVCRSAPASSAGVARVLTTVGVAAAVTAGLWLEAGRAWLWVVSSVAPSPYDVFERMAPPAAIGAALLFVVMTTVHYSVAAADERRLAVGRALEAELAAREAELRALRAQVDPHFLFNVLHSISALVSSEPAVARWMCIELASFFRESLRAGAQTRIPLAAEAALVRRYLDIESRRFGDRLRTAIAIAPEAEPALVPPLLLQPLAENAVRHGIATLVEGGALTIAAVRRGDRIEVRIENPFDPEVRRAGGGLGIPNVRARLDAMYGDRASLRVEAAGSQFCATISLPMEEVS